MTTYTNDLLDRLCKQDLVLIVLSPQSKLDEANNDILEEVSKLSDVFPPTKLWTICYKKGYSLLPSRLVKMAWQ